MAAIHISWEDHHADVRQVSCVRNRSGNRWARAGRRPDQGYPRGVFCDSREGFFLLDVDSGEELLNLLGGGILDYANVETHPVMSFEKLGEFFKKDAAQA